MDVRKKQIDSIIRMLHFNSNPLASSSRTEDEIFKVLILDRFTKDVLAPLLRVNDLRKHGVTLHLMLENDRQPIPDVPAVYFVQPTDKNIDILIEDAKNGLYNALYINFVSHLERPLMEKLASRTVAAQCSQRLAQLYDKYISFVALESNLFSLGLHDAYVELNDPSKKDTEVEDSVAKVVDGLFCVLATLGVIPIIRCPKGGAAEHVAAKLNAKLQEHLKARNNLFSESTPGLATSLSRPLLCLFDRNFELSVIIQHSWTYKPMVHDVLAMKLNRVTFSVPEANHSPGPSIARQGSGNKKTYEVSQQDFFWNEHGRKQFPKIAEEVENLVKNYKTAVEEMSQKTGMELDPTMDPDEMMQSNTRNLMVAVSALPELTEKKRVMDKHTDIATALLRNIQGRELDKYYNVEEDMLQGKGDTNMIKKLLQGAKGTAGDKLRLVLVYLLTCDTLPTENDMDQLQRLLADAGADLTPLTYVVKMRKMNLTGKMTNSQSVSEGLGALGGANTSHLLNWADKTFGQGLSSLTKGVKNLLAGEQQAAVTVAVETLMDGRTPQEADPFAYFDPKAVPGRAAWQAGPFSEAIVFMIGGGNYLEYESLATWASRSQPAKSIMYGATDILTADAFVEQLATLGRHTH